MDHRGATDLPPLLGRSSSFLALMDQVSRAAPLNRPVLVIGERGTGKELIAARLHFLSQRWERTLVKVNCAALPENLIESELFGHEAGAFTGAAKRRGGRFEMADGGSLILDEIANAGLAVQEKILRVVEYGAFERVGGDATQHVDVRLIGATNIDLPAAAEAGRFRHDLLDRLAFEVLTIPPLRDRTEDIPLLAEAFGHDIARELGWRSFPGFRPTVMDRLMAYPWPGNVRELKNVVERAVYRAADREVSIDTVVFDPFESPYRPAGPASFDDLSEDTVETAASETVLNETGVDETVGSETTDFRAQVAALEVRLLKDAWRHHRYNQRLTAEYLGLTYDQFRNQLRKHDLLRPASGVGEERGQRVK